MNVRYDKDLKLNENEIDLREISYVLFKGKWIIASVTAFAFIITLIYSLSLPNIYQSKALLVPVDSPDGISGAINGYSNLASLAGISLPSQGGENNAAKAIEKLNSLSFFENNILPNIFLPELMAVSSWNPNTNTLVFDEKIYKESNNTWTRESSYSQRSMPSPQESYAIFKGKHLSIIKDQKNGFVTLAIKHQSPYVAKEWADLLIYQINSYYREKDRADAQKAASYLNAQIVKTSFTEIKQVIAGLLQQETQKLTLIEVNESYVFNFIDPPAVMEKKIEPKRSLICIFGALLGGMLGIFLVLVKYYGFRKIDS